MDGWEILVVGAVVAAIFWIGHLVSQRSAERLDAELTAYVAEGTITPDTAKAILESPATIHRKREVAALIAEGMEPDKGIAILQAMAAA